MYKSSICYYIYYTHFSVYPSAARQLFCMPSITYLKNSCASSWCPNLKCFAMTRKENCFVSAIVLNTGFVEVPIISSLDSRLTYNADFSTKQGHSAVFLRIYNALNSGSSSLNPGKFIGTGMKKMPIINCFLHWSDWLPQNCLLLTSLRQNENNAMQALIGVFGQSFLKNC